MSKSPPPPFFVFRGQENEITAVHFPAETDCALTCSTLFTGNRNGQIVLYDLKSFRAYHEFTAHDGKMIVGLNYITSSLLSQGREGILKIWSLSDDQWRLLRTIVCENTGFCASELFLANSHFYIVSYNDTLHDLGIYDYETGSKSKSLELNTDGMCMCLKVIHIQDKTLILCGCESGNIILFDFDAACEVSKLKCHDEPILCIDYDDKHNNRGISGSPEDFLQTWSIMEDLEIMKEKRIQLPNPGANVVKVRQDGKIVIVAGHDSSIRVFSWKTLKPLAVLSFHKLAIHCLAFCPTPVGKATGVFASGSKDQNVALWSLY